MAFSKRQYENFIRVIVVAAIAKEFRKAKIIESAVKKAITDGKVATGGLIRPDVTGSMIPSRDDRWLIKKEAVQVNVGSVVYNTPLRVSVNIQLEYGTDENYIYTRRELNAKWPLGKLPNVNRIKTWIIAKSSRGMINFTYRGKPLDTSNDKQVTRMAFTIRRSIGRKGIKEKYKSNYFEKVGDKAEKAVQAGLRKASDRIVEKYQQEIFRSSVEMIDKNIA